MLDITYNKQAEFLAMEEMPDFSDAMKYDLERLSEIVKTAVHSNHDGSARKFALAAGVNHVLIYDLMDPTKWAESGKPNPSLDTQLKIISAAGRELHDFPKEEG